jgi:hypothetical protein
MQNNRRLWLRSLTAAALSSLVLALASAQDASTSKTGPLRPGEDEANVPNRPTTKAILDENQKDIKKSVEKLFDLASQLKEQVEKTDSTTVLSLAMVKKAEQIEHLARQIKDRAKG